MRISCALVVLFIAYAAVPSPSQSMMLEQAVTVLAPTEFRIVRGDCLVAWMPVYCRVPGTGYTLQVVAGAKKGAHAPRKFSAAVIERGTVSWPVYGATGPSQEKRICLLGRNVLRVLLQGEPGDRISVSIHAEKGQVDLHSFSIEGPAITMMSPTRLSPTAAPRPLPVVTLAVDRKAIAIGEKIELTWDAHDARSVAFTSGELGKVGSSGSALVWPEKDTVFRLEASNDDGRAVAEAAVTVAVPDPELELSIEPQQAYKGDQATLRWKTRNARLVRFADQPLSSLPLSGSMKVEARDYPGFTLQAENGEKRVNRSVTMRVRDRAEEERRIADEKARRHIPPAIDRELQGIWDSLRSALKAGDVDKAVSLYCLEERDKAREIYSSMKEQLPVIGAEMKGVQFIEYLGDGAKYRTKRKEILQGKEHDITYYVFFVRDIDGAWRIYQF